MIESMYLKAGFLLSLLFNFIVQIKKLIVIRHTFMPYLFLMLTISFTVFVFLFMLRKVVAIVLFFRQKNVFLELTPPAFTEKTAYTTQQVFSVLHHVGMQRTFFEKLLGKKILYSLEIVSTKAQGIRYIIRTPKDEALIVERIVMAYLPQIRVTQIDEYLPEKNLTQKAKVIEFTLQKHFAFPLATQNILTQHDPIAYITGMMTKLSSTEMIGLQIVVSPIRKKETQLLTQKILRNEDVVEYLNKPQIPVYIKLFFVLVIGVIKLIQVVTKEIGWAITEVVHGSPTQQHYAYSHMQQQNILISQRIKPARVLTTFEQEIVTMIQKKINQDLFETSIRAFVLVNKRRDRKERIRGLQSSLAPFSVPKYQSLKAVYTFPPVLSDKLRVFAFKQRAVSLFQSKSSSLLSVSEISDLYHFPYTRTTKTENIVKVQSTYLPAPLSLKNGRNLQVVFGENTYGGTITPIGLTKEERETHMYLIGRTGSGKTTLMFSMAKHDIERGEGMAFIDPHGDVSEELLACIPEDRANDLIYLNPIDLKHPIGINLLELTPNLEENEAELEKELVCEGVISLFRKVFSSDEEKKCWDVTEECDFFIGIFPK